MKYIKRKYFIILLLSLLLTNSIFSQDSKFTLSIGGGYHKIRMSKFNQNFLDSFSIPLEMFNERMEYAYCINQSIGYQVYPYFLLSVSYSKLFTHITGTPKFVSYKLIDSHYVEQTFHGKSFFYITSDLILIKPGVLIHEILKFQNRKKSVICNTKIYINTEFGYGWAQARGDFYSPNDTAFAINYQNYSHYTKANGFSLNPSFQIEYPIFKKGLNLYLGTEIGYRFYQTNTLTDIYNKKWYVGASEDKNSINLDFNGFFISGYLRIYK